MIRCNLAILLAEKGLKITDVSRETGISRTTLTSLSNNYSKGVQFDTVNELCNYLNTTPDKLLSYIPIDINIGEITRNDDDNSDLLNINININKNHFIYSSYLEAKCSFHCSDSVQNLNLGRELHDKAKILNDIDITITIRPINLDPDNFHQSKIIEIINSLPEVFKNDFKNELIDNIIKFYGFSISQENYKCIFRWDWFLD